MNETTYTATIGFVFAALLMLFTNIAKADSRHQDTQTIIIKPGPSHCVESCGGWTNTCTRSCM